MLNRKIHPNKSLQVDWNLYGPDLFQFIVLHQGHEWDELPLRRSKELEYILHNRSQAYNVYEGIHNPGDTNPFWGKTHTEATKQKIRNALKGIPNDKLGKKVSIQGSQYPSIAEASRQTNHSRNLIRKRIQDPNYPEWSESENA